MSEPAPIVKASAVVTSRNAGTQKISLLLVAVALLYTRSGVETTGGSQGAKFDRVMPAIVCDNV